MPNSNVTNTASIGTVTKNLFQDYLDDTPQRLKLIDAYMLFCVITGLVQFAYCILVGTFPYNAFLAGFGSAVACFVFAANLRIKTNPANKSQFSGSPESAFAEFIFCHIILHFTVANFLG